MLILCPGNREFSCQYDGKTCGKISFLTSRIPTYVLSFRIAVVVWTLMRSAIVTSPSPPSHPSLRVRIAAPWTSIFQVIHHDFSSTNFPRWAMPVVFDPGVYFLLNSEIEISQLFIFRSTDDSAYETSISRQIIHHTTRLELVCITSSTGNLRKIEKNFPLFM